MSYLIIDGSQGEGGGQVLRTALTLAMLTQQNIELINIRAGRKKPGLLRQHLTSVIAAQKVCNASTEGVELGANSIRFAPGKIKAGDFHFVIGTAGSTVLVCQTVLPVLALADGKSTVTFEGGTHNGMSPSLSFLEKSYLPVLQSLGVNCKVEIESLGFYPAGGGKWTLNIEPTDALKAFEFEEPGADLVPAYGEIPPEHSHDVNYSATALVSLLPSRIGLREVETAKRALGWVNAISEVQEVKTPGPGNSFHLAIQASNYASVFEVTGEVGVSSEKVAKRAAGRVKKFLKARAAVEEHLADQLLLLLAIAGKGSFTTTKPSLHTTTNIAVIHQLSGKLIDVEGINDDLWRVSLGS